MANAIATELAAHARDLLTKLRAMTADSSLAGGKPNANAGAGFDTIDHQGYRAKLRNELMEVLDRLEKLGYTVDESGALVATYGFAETVGVPL